MAEIVRMPKMSDTMTEGVVSKWHKKVGDHIKTGELVAEIETDKATMEFESYQEGVLLYRGVEEGKAAPVNGVLAILGKKGEDYKSLLEGEKKATPAAEAAAPATPKAEPAKPAAKAAAAPSPTPAPAATPKPAVAPLAPNANDSRLKASPLARRLAEEKGLDLRHVNGTGDHGRIVKRDIDWYKQMPNGGGLAMPGFVATEGFDEIELSQMRKTIARRLAESKYSAPHFYLTMEIDMGRAVDARESINAIAPLKTSFNDMILKAAAMALRQHPKVNASWLGDKIRMHHHIHIGVAVAVEEGLLVPVVRFADGKTLSQIGAEVKEYAQKAKDKKLQPSDWEGNTFTISNLGMFGIDQFTAIINPPDACILAIGAINDAAVVKDGKVVAGKKMKVTMSCDHRAVDGAIGSAFLQTFRQLLENPVLMLGMSSI